MDDIDLLPHVFQVCHVLALLSHANTHHHHRSHASLCLYGSLPKTQSLKVVKELLNGLKVTKKSSNPSVPNAV